MASHGTSHGTSRGAGPEVGGSEFVDRVVSFESEELILVDESDCETGHMSKAECHDGDGILHRAFSLFIFNSAGAVLLQQRAAGKRLWGGYWSNSCCSHPRRGEAMDAAVQRRLFQELGLSCTLDFLYKFSYHAKFEDKGSERELCWVYAGRSDDDVLVNANEIMEWRFVSPEDLDQEIATTPERFTPWFKMEWERIQRDYADILKSI